MPAINAFQKIPVIGDETRRIPGKGGKNVSSVESSMESDRMPGILPKSNDLCHNLLLLQAREASFYPAPRQTKIPVSDKLPKSEFP